MNEITVTDRDFCQSCTFFVAQDSAGGTCHRFPPQFVGDGITVDAHRWRFPWVWHHGWCGEHRRDPSPGAAP